MLIISHILICLKNVYRGSNIEITAIGLNLEVQEVKRVGYCLFSSSCRDRESSVAIEILGSMS